MPKKFEMRFVLWDFPAYDSYYDKRNQSPNCRGVFLNCCRYNLFYGELQMKVDIGISGYTNMQNSAKRLKIPRNFVIYLSDCWN